ncbi:hypothetical protein R75461_08255 [Paraburkholderia nemoris]|uniref:hypothetical protein n=1 Tax=Paraburkholderia nemoris TaxID=2793076 RepID=UPI00190C3166|nr:MULTISPECIES: hypothetical protein [Paraburkholderia]MBK3787196.1 hypothetical protein [Paraburkholderia aspalathi]CAE6865596.1 hypothetical protein R75461_08255 [Paraburkholderia nemoris]
MARTSRRTVSKPTRKPLTKDMLLPLPVARVRALSLENHLFLAAIRGGHGSMEVAMNLLRVLYLSWFMRDAADAERDLDVFREAEAVLARGRIRAHQHQGWTLPEEDHRVLEHILALHDQQLASMPSHRYIVAWERLQRFLRSDDWSPIGPGGPDEDEEQKC